MLRSAARQHGYSVPRVVNKFSQKTFNQPPNIHVNLQFADGWIGEVQLTLGDCLSAKHCLHKAYEIERAGGVSELLEPVFNVLPPGLQKLPASHTSSGDTA